MAAEELIRIHVMHTGHVCAAPELPFGGQHCSILKASGVFTKKKDRLWLPVSAYLIECSHGTILFDTGWSRTMSPKGREDPSAQIASLGSRLLYTINPGMLPEGESAKEQLAAMGIPAYRLDLVLLSHLDCDHANGLQDVKNAKRLLVSADELFYARKRTPVNIIRYQKCWWKDTRLCGFLWNGTEGPAGKSYDVFGDGMLKMINIPGHSEGQCALKITASDGRFVLLYADGGYAEKSWKEQILPGIGDDRKAQKKSLEWIRDMSNNPLCVESLANHDSKVAPHVIELQKGKA